MPAHTLGDLINETLDHLYRAVERPWQTAVGSNDLTDISDTQLTLADGAPVNTSDLLEIGSELMLVTGKTDDAIPVFTVSRGYLGTERAAASTGSPVLKNPPYPRYQVARAIRRFVAGPLTSQLPLVQSIATTRTPNQQYVEMDTDVIRVLEVQHMNQITGRIIDLAGWRFEQDLPTSIVPSGKLLRLPSVVTDADEVIVKYQAPYTWTGDGEAAAVTLPAGAEDLPSLWAAAYLTSRREITRLELDHIEEWPQEQAVARLGSNARLIRELWGEFYRRLDEARDIHYVPRHRPYRKMPKLI